MISTPAGDEGNERYCLLLATDGHLPSDFRRSAPSREQARAQSCRPPRLSACIERGPTGYFLLTTTYIIRIIIASDRKTQKI